MAPEPRKNKQKHLEAEADLDELRQHGWGGSVDDEEVHALVLNEAGLHGMSVVSGSHAGSTLLYLVTDKGDTLSLWRGAGQEGCCFVWVHT